MRRVSLRRACLIVPLGIGGAFCLLVGAGYLVDQVKYRSLVTHVGQIHIGDSKEEVIQVIGKPMTVWPKGLYYMDAQYFEIWIYGRRLCSLQDLKYAFSPEPPYFWPVKMRLLRARADDVIAKFDDRGRVVEIVALEEQGQESTD